MQLRQPLSRLLHLQLLCARVGIGLHLLGTFLRCLRICLHSLDTLFSSAALFNFFQCHTSPRQSCIYRGLWGLRTDNQLDLVEQPLKTHCGLLASGILYGRSTRFAAAQPELGPMARTNPKPPDHFWKCGGRLVNNNLPLEFSGPSSRSRTKRRIELG
jgi:hypothetical protein